MSRRVLATALWVLAAGATPVACATTDGDDKLPQHYQDKKSALAAFDDPARDAWAQPDKVVDALPLEAGMTVADIGAGSGYFSRRLAKKVPEGKVIAVDVDADFVHFVKSNRDTWGTPNVEPKLALYEHPMLVANSIDLVFVSNTYAYIRDRDEYFKHVHDALRDGGMLVVVGFRLDATLEGVADPPTREQRVPRDAVVTQLEGLGFKLDGEETFLPHQYLLVFKKAAG